MCLKVRPTAPCQGDLVHNHYRAHAHIRTRTHTLFYTHTHARTQAHTHTTLTQSQTKTQTYTPCTHAQHKNSVSQPWMNTTENTSTRCAATTPNAPTYTHTQHTVSPQTIHTHTHAHCTNRPHAHTQIHIRIHTPPPTPPTRNQIPRSLGAQVCYKNADRHGANRTRRSRHLHNQVAWEPKPRRRAHPHKKSK